MAVEAVPVWMQSCRLSSKPIDPHWSGTTALPAVGITGLRASLPCDGVKSHQDPDIVTDLRRPISPDCATLGPRVPLALKPAGARGKGPKPLVCQPHYRTAMCAPCGAIPTIIPTSGLFTHPDITDIKAPGS